MRRRDPTPLSPALALYIYGRERIVLRLHNAMPYLLSLSTPLTPTMLFNRNAHATRLFFCIPQKCCLVVSYGRSNSYKGGNTKKSYCVEFRTALTAECLREEGFFHGAHYHSLSSVLQSHSPFPFFFPSSRTKSKAFFFGLLRPSFLPSFPAPLGLTDGATHNLLWKWGSRLSLSGARL